MNQPAIQPDDQVLVTQAAFNAAQALGLRRAQLSRIVGLSEPTLTRMKRGQSTIPQGKAFELALLLIRIYRALYAIVGGDEPSLKHWIKTPNRHLQESAPAELMESVEGMVAVARYLDAMRGRL
ncbi:MAG TPA: XRE family transcriptional regulator [Gammaproteobacteria bacterium]|nr:XRE family transcriptional regulator [Gammaproteobacteria bacterium]